MTKDERKLFDKCRCGHIRQTHLQYARSGRTSFCSASHRYGGCGCVGFVPAAGQHDLGQELVRRASDSLEWCTAGTATELAE